MNEGPKLVNPLPNIKTVFKELIAEIADLLREEVVDEDYSVRNFELSQEF